MMHGMHAFSMFAFLPLIIYLGLVILGVWFVITLIKTLREKNQILKEISETLKKHDRDEL